MPLQQPYDRIHYDPPAPVVDIIVKPQPASSRQVSKNVRTLLDSGADATMLPESLLARIGAIRIDRRRSRGVYIPTGLAKRPGRLTVAAAYRSLAGPLILVTIAARLQPPIRPPPVPRRRDSRNNDRHRRSHSRRGDRRGGLGCSRCCHC